MVTGALKERHLRALEQPRKRNPAGQRPFFPLAESDAAAWLAFGDGD